MPELRLTDDGSMTLLDSDSGECFHSSKGALTESEHVFIQAGQLEQKLQHCKQRGSALYVLEMGFGTGLNYLLTARAAIRAGVELRYHALENQLLDSSTLSSLGYAELLALDDLYQAFIESFEQIDAHSKQTQTVENLSGQLTLHLGDALLAELPSEKFSLCYYDAFSPSSAPKLWQQAQLLKFHNALEKSGTWVSYCAKGDVRRALIACGFEVERLAGPPGKREMLRATRLK